MPREDTSQLTQELVNIHRNPEASILNYGTRVSVLLNKTENAIKNFVCELDRDTLTFMKDKSKL